MSLAADAARDIFAASRSAAIAAVRQQERAKFKWIHVTTRLVALQPGSKAPLTGTM